MKTGIKSGPLIVFCLACAGASVASAQTPAPNTNRWESSAQAGLTLTRGNSDTMLGTFGATTHRKWDHDELSFGADAIYGETKNDGVTTRNANSIRGFGQYNRYFSDRFYGYGRVEGLHDESADIRYRVTRAPGAGYFFIKEKKVDLSGELGPGYIFERLGTNDSNYATLRVGEKFHWQLSDHARLWQTLEWLPKVEDFNDYIVNFEIGIEADITARGKVTLRTFLQDTYNSDPAPGREKNDAKLVSAIVYKF